MTSLLSRKEARTGSLDNLDGCINSVAGAVKRLHDLGNNRLAEMRQKRNAHLPIQKLPPEILLHIFPLALQNNGPISPDGFSGIIDGNQYYAQLHQLTQVCQKWSKLVLGCQMLWRVIDCTQPTSTIRTALRRSAGHTLNVSFNCPRPTPGRPVTDKTVFNEVCSHSSRWETATLVLRTSEQLKMLRTSSAPALTQLELKKDFGTDDEAKAINLFGGSTPKLSILSLSGFALPKGNVPFLNRLTSLSIQHILGPDGPSVAELFRCIGLTSGTLESLALFSIHFALPASIDQSPPLLYPELEYFCLGGCGVDATSRILGTFNAPRCRRIRLRLTTYAERPLLHDTYKAFIINRLQSERLGIAAIDVRVDGTSLLMSPRPLEDYRQQLTDFYLESSPLNFTPFVIPLCFNTLQHAVLGVPTTFKISNTAIGMDNASTTLKTILHCLKDVSRLEFENLPGDDRLSHVVHILGRPEAGQWLCSKMESLRIDGSYVRAELLLDMFRQRSWKSGRSGEPTPIKFFEVKHCDTMDRRTWKLIQKALGSDARCIWWDQPDDVAEGFYYDQESGYELDLVFGS